MPKTHPVKLLVVHILAVLAYLALLFEWTMLALPYIAGAIKSDTYKSILADHPRPTVEPAAQALPEWAVLVIVGVLLIGALAAVAMSLSRAPKAIVETGEKITRQAAEAIIPVVTRRHHVPEKKRAVLTARLVFYIKLALLIIPILVALFVPLPDQSKLTREMLLIVVGLSAVWALLLFGLQHLARRMFRISPSKRW